MEEQLSVGDELSLPAGVYLTKTEVEKMHAANVAEISALHEELRSLKLSTEEIIEWTKNGKLGAKIIFKMLHCIGVSAIWFIKVTGVIVVIWGIIAAIRQGKLPDINLNNLPK